jgi:hypothetical protein
MRKKFYLKILKNSWDFINTLKMVTENKLMRMVTFRKKLINKN